MNNGHNCSASNINNSINNDFNERSLANQDYNKPVVQSDIVITTSSNLSKGLAIINGDDKVNSDALCDNTSLLINLCIPNNNNNVKSSSNNSIACSFNSKSMKLKNPILDEQSDVQYVTSPTSDIGKELDDGYCSDNSFFVPNDGSKIPKSKNIPINKRNSNFDFINNSIANSNCSSYSEKFIDASFSNITNSENKSSTINGQQIYPILYSDPLDYSQNKNNNYESYSYTINIKKNLIKELIETKEKADAEIYDIYSIWLEDKNSEYDNEEGINKLGYNYNNNSTSFTSLLSLNYSNSSININNEINQSLYDSTESLNNNNNNNNASNESINNNNKSYTSYPILFTPNNN
eukprot:jgi/Orpsp1_1/1192923/evm.model.d7180000096929.1